MPNIKSHLAESIATAISAALPEIDIPALEITRTKQATHGDYACNVALILAKQLKRKPREVAQAIVDALPSSPWVEKTEIAGLASLIFS